MKVRFFIFLLVVCSLSEMLSESLSHQNELMTTLKFVRKLFNRISKVAFTVMPLIFMIDS